MKNFKLIAIGTLKGGVGKTTIVVNLAATLAEKNKKVLVIDADPQANTSTYLGLDETESNYKSIKDIFDDRHINPESLVYKTGITNLEVIGSTILLTATERKFATMSFAEQQLKKYIDRNIDFFNKYDYIIVDTNPSMSKTNQNVFVAADKIICVSDVGIGAYKGIELFDYLLSELADESELNLKIDAILLNKFTKANNLSKDYLEYLQSEDLTKDILLKSTIKISVKLGEAELEQTPITKYKPGKESAAEFVNIVSELTERGVL